ncbi:MAG: elongation factor P maturation arginine rhamnosyltransferase EarP [Sulfuricella sp.]
MTQHGRKWDIFCAVVDNFGDIGVCWRLARQLAAEYDIEVRLWVDDLASLQTICPEINPDLTVQTMRRVDVRRWDASFPVVAPAEVVIEAFGCELPAGYVAAMAALARKPVWINLEYLSAENWVEGCHGLPSPHPRLPLTKYFFFPGFSSATGGLLAENGLLQRRQAFQSDSEQLAQFWQSIGLPQPEAEECRVSLFGYENSALPGLLEAWASGAFPVTCMVPEGRMVTGVAAYFGRSDLARGESLQRGRLSVHVLPFLEQERYDYLLWACDCNFVRGEDSFVRGQWAARPFIWHIYPQDEGAHWVKLHAFLDRYCDALPVDAAAAVRGVWEAWNRGEGAGEAWPAFWQWREALERHAQRWADARMIHGDLAANLVQFCWKKI